MTRRSRACAWFLIATVAFAVLASRSRAPGAQESAADSQQAEAVPAEVTKLIEDLRSDDLTKRRNAAFDLGKLGPEAAPAVDALVVALKDNDPQVWLDSVQALARIGPAAHPAIDSLIDELDSRDAQRRYRASYALGAIGEKAVVALRGAMADRNATMRESAARAAAFMGAEGKHAQDELARLLDDENDQVRTQAAAALGGFGELAERSLAEALKSDSARERCAAAQALKIAVPRQNETVAQLFTAATDRDASVRAAAVSALAVSKAPAGELAPIISSALRDGDVAVRDASIAALMKLGAASEKAVPELVALLESDDPAARSSAAYALGRIGPAGRAAAPALLAALERRPDEAASIIQTLGRLGPSMVPVLLDAAPASTVKPETLADAAAAVGAAALQPLIDATHHSSPAVRRIAALSLGRIAPPRKEAVDPLVRLVSDSSVDVQSGAVESLGSLGVLAAGAVDAISPLLTSGEPVLRATSLVAITHIDPERAAPLLPKAFDDADPAVRLAAVDAADAFAARNPDALRNIDLIAGLVSSLEDADAAVRLRTATTLGRCFAKESTRELPELSPKGLSAANASDRLSAALSDADWRVREAAAKAMGDIGVASPGAIELLAGRLDDEDTKVVYAALVAFQKFSAAEKSAAVPEMAGSKIVTLVDSPEGLVRTAAIDALAEFEESYVENTPRLIRALDDSEWPVRKSATIALGRIGGPAKAAMPRLFEMLASDEDRETARGAIRQIDDIEPEALPVLIKALESEDRAARFFAVYYLGKLGPAASEALPALRRLDADDSNRFRRSVSEAIRAIEADSSEGK